MNHFFPKYEYFEIKTIGSLKFLYHKGCELYKQGIKMKWNEDCKFHSPIYRDPSPEYTNEILFGSVMEAIFHGEFPISDNNWYPQCYENYLSSLKQRYENYFTLLEHFFQSGSERTMFEWVDDRSVSPFVGGYDTFPVWYKDFAEEIHSLEIAKEPNELNMLSDDKDYKKFLKILEMINNQDEKKFSINLRFPFDTSDERKASSYPPTFVEYIEQCIANTVDLND